MTAYRWLRVWLCTEAGIPHFVRNDIGGGGGGMGMPE